MRLLLLGPINSPHVEHLALAMRERGHEVAVAGEAADSLPASGLPAAGIPTTEIRGRDLVAVRRALRRTQPDVVHAHWLPGAAFMAALVRARPLIAMAWGSDVYAADRRRLLQCRYALRRSDVAMADSRALLDRLIELGAAPERAQLMRWGVDLELFSPAAGPGGREARARPARRPPDPQPRAAWRRSTTPMSSCPRSSGCASACPTRCWCSSTWARASRRSPAGSSRRASASSGNVPYEQLPAYFRAADVCVVDPALRQLAALGLGGDGVRLPVRAVRPALDRAS